jgi:hypothetical protein
MAWVKMTHKKGLTCMQVGVEKFAKNVDIKHHKRIEYPSERFDLIWTVVKPYDEIVDVTSEAIPGLDDKTGMSAESDAKDFAIDAEEK